MQNKVKTMGVLNQSIGNKGEGGRLYWDLYVRI